MELCSIHLDDALAGEQEDAEVYSGETEGEEVLDSAQEDFLQSGRTLFPGMRQQGRVSEGGLWRIVTWIRDA